MVDPMVSKLEQLVLIYRVTTSFYCYYRTPIGGYMSIMCLAQRPDIFKVRRLQ